MTIMPAVSIGFHTSLFIFVNLYNQQIWQETQQQQQQQQQRRIADKVVLYVRILIIIL